MSTTNAPRVGFVLEQSLGHVTHADNLRSIISSDPSIEPCWLPIPFAPSGVGARVPLYATNWSVRAGLRARRAIRTAHASAPLDALFVHTQVPAVLSSDWFRRIPTVVSIDATPKQYDALGLHYDHAESSAPVERVKSWLNRRCFSEARAVVSWSQWAKDGLVDAYGVDADKVTVIPPGVWYAAWAGDRRPAPEPGSVRFLFVGGDFERKGGAALLGAFRRLRAELVGEVDVSLDLVTSAAVVDEPGVTVHRSLTANSEPLKELYRRADVFCLPTRGDCLPMVLSEAGAAGLPLVSTSVGAIPEIVRDGETGLVIPSDDGDALTAALRRLATDPSLRGRLGDGARELVRTSFDAEANARRLVALLRDVAAASPRRATA